jgi:hypothetical protein
MTMSDDDDDYLSDPNPPIVPNYLAVVVADGAELARAFRR